MDSELKEEICRVMKELYERGLVSALTGNVSARLPSTNEFWITPSGVHKGRLAPSSLLKLDMDLRVLEGSGKPSIESMAHARIYRVRPDVNAIVHAHNPITVGLAMAGVSIKPLVEGSVIGSVEVVPFAPPGSRELAESVEEKAKKANALILQRHGVMTLGANLTEAEALAESLEDASKSVLVYALMKLKGAWRPSAPS